MKHLHKTFPFALAALLGTGAASAATPPPPQSTIVVDGLTGTENGPKFASITNAVMASSPGDTIQVNAMEFNGEPYGYNENPHPLNPNVSGENFPIMINKDLTIQGRQNGVGPVFIYSITGPTTSKKSFFVVDNSSSGADITVNILNLHILGMGEISSSMGANVGALDVYSFSQHMIDLTLKNLVFSHNALAVSLRASEGTILADIRKPTIAEENITLGVRIPPSQPLPNPILEIPVQGFSLIADEEGNSPGQVDATFTNFQTMGLFQGGANPGQFDELVHIDSTGTTVEANGANPIAQVKVTFMGGTLHGEASAGIPPLVPPGGWKTGIHATTVGGSSVAQSDYEAAFNVILSGTLVTDFRDTGIWAKAGGDSRGRVELTGATRVQRTGSQNGSGSPSGGQEMGTGLYLEAFEGYLEFTTGGSPANHPLISDNWRDGAHVVALSTDEDTIHLRQPMGAYMSVETAEVRLNREDGVHLEARGGIAGSTWTFDGFNGLQDLKVLSSPQSANPNVMSGFGLMNDCLVNNNTAKGLRVDLTQKQDAKDIASIGALRVFNTYFWNNGEEAIYADGPNDQTSSGFAVALLLPVIHCTIAGNGDSVDQDVEIPDGAGKLDKFNWIEDDLNNPGTNLYAHTKFFDSIFQRKNNPMTDPDFGTGVGQRLAAEGASTLQSISSYNPTLIYVGGIRQKDKNKTGDQGTDQPAPFLGSPIVWTSSDVTQFFLPIDPAPDFHLTPTHLGLLDGIAELMNDLLGDLRPALSTGMRDKGGRENQ